MKSGLCLLLCAFFASANGQVLGDFNGSRMGLGFTRYGFYFDYLKKINPKPNRRLNPTVDISLGNIMNPQEISVINPNSQGGGVYKFEKINYAWTFEPKIGLNYAYKNFDQNGIVPELNFSIGPSLAYTWPVYIKYITPDSITGNARISEERYNQEVHDQRFISERASFTNELTSGSMNIGLVAAVGVSFNNLMSFGGYRAIGVGLRLQYYPGSKAPIYFNERLNRRVYSSFYINFAFGS